MKYIPSDKLIAEIERLKGQLIQGACAAQIEMETNCKDEAYNEVLSFITALQQEQPPLPSNLDEAARECCKEEINGETRYYPAIEYYFKAGAKWQKEHMDK